MKILLVGASSDIACDLFARYNNEYQFVRLSSNNDHSTLKTLIFKIRLLI